MISRPGYTTVHCDPLSSRTLDDVIGQVDQGQLALRRCCRQHPREKVKIKTVAETNLSELPIPKLARSEGTFCDGTKSSGTRLGDGCDTTSVNLWGWSDVMTQKMGHKRSRSHKPYAFTDVLTLNALLRVLQLPELAGEDLLRE